MIKFPPIQTFTFFLSVPNHEFNLFGLGHNVAYNCSYGRTWLGSLIAACLFVYLFTPRVHISIGLLAYVVGPQRKEREMRVVDGDVGK